MAVMNLRNVPEALARRAKASAVMAGITLGDWVAEAIEQYLLPHDKGCECKICKPETK